MNKKTHHYLYWKLDQADNLNHKNFIKSLSAKEREFFEKFEAEFVRAEFKEDCLHKKEQKKDLTNAAAHSRFDLLNGHRDQVAKKQAEVPKAHANRNRYYAINDYSSESAMSRHEDLLVDLIDFLSPKSKK